MAFTKDDVLYGLRNLATGDEEETKIGDYGTEDLPDEAIALIQAGDFIHAYDVTIKESGIKVTFEECMEWVLDKGYADCYEEMVIEARNMMLEQESVWHDGDHTFSGKCIDGIEYTYVVDEGFAPGWPEQIAEAWPNREGPFYIYKGPEDVTTIVSVAPLDEEQLTVLRNPQDPLL